MNNDLIETLRSVLKEELEPVNKRLGSIEQTLVEHNKRFDLFDQTLVEQNKRFDLIDQSLAEHNQRFDLIDQTLAEHNNQFNLMEQDLKDIKTGQERLQKNIIHNIGDYSEKIVEYVDNKTEALNKRVYTTETEIQRLTRQ